MNAVRCGSEYGGYSVVPSKIGNGALVYSLGVGEDLSFDLELMQRFDVQVHAFDPTPRSQTFVEQQDLPEHFEFHPWGVADFDGVADFSPPENPEHVSHSLVLKEGRTRAPIEVPVKRLSTIMGELGHSHVDLLKLDIEGSEYGLLEDLVKSELRPTQILVEYHHHMPGMTLKQTEDSLEALRRAGYRVFDVSPTGHEFSLLLTE